MVTRRRALLFAGAGMVAWSASGGEFWEKKPPAEWTSEEIDRLIEKSPWAKEVAADYAPESGAGSRGGSSHIGLGIPGIGGRGGRNRTGGQRGGASSYKGTVRWESAKPILEAMKAPLPDQFAGHYVISVNGFPLLGREQEDDQWENLKQLTSLQPKGKELAQAGVVHRQVSAGSSFLFGFSREFLGLGVEDKDVVFSSRFGQLTVKAKFELKEMLYHGELAV